MQYTVKLDGEELKLRYRLQDREWVESIFPRPDGTPASMAILTREHMMGPGSVAVQAALIYAGLRHLEDEEWTIVRVKTALGELSGKDKDGKSSELATVVRDTMKAILLSGVLGFVSNLEPKPSKKPKESEADDPNAQGPTS